MSARRDIAIGVLVPIACCLGFTWWTGGPNDAAPDAGAQPHSARVSPREPTTEEALRMTISDAQRFAGSCEKCRATLRGRDLLIETTDCSPAAMNRLMQSLRGLGLLRSVDCDSPSRHRRVDLSPAQPNTALDDAPAVAENITAAIGFAVARSGAAHVSGRSIRLDLPECTAGTAESLARALPRPEDIDDVECASSRATTVFYLHPPDAAPK